ncbi:hypothetical protein Tco_0486732 [Tanacetum coccineum]
MKRPRESKASSSSTTQNPPSSRLQIDAMIDDNDDESFHSNSSSHSQHISSLSNVDSRVRQSKGIPHHSCKENLKYLKGTPTLGRLCYDYLICWSVKNQQSVVMSSAKVEYVVAARCCANTLWMKSQLSDYDIQYKMVPIFCDNTSAIAISNNSCTDVVDLPKPPSDDQESRPLKESIIKFTIKNGKTPLSFNFKTFVQTTRLDYNNGQYEALLLMEVMKVELLELGLHIEKKMEESAVDLVNRTPLLKIWFSMAWRILVTFVIQVLGGNKSSTDQLNLIQQMIVYRLLIGAKIDIGDIIFNELVTRLTDKPRNKCVAYPMFLSCVLENLLGSEYTQDKALGSIPSVLSK